MKKSILIILCLMTLVLAGCKRNDEADRNASVVSPTAAPTVTLPEGPSPSPMVENTLSIQDYYPVEADSQYQYDGEGNEFAAYIRYIEFIDENTGRVQTRTQTGGTDTVHVLELKDGTLSVVYTVNECYYRKNFLTMTQEEPEVLLMEPLQAGTAWTLPDGRRRAISSIDTKVVTPYGTFQALEVTTEEENAVTRDYYAAGVGLVESLYESKEAADMKVASILGRVNKNTPLMQSLRIFYPDTDEKINEVNAVLSFQTGEEAKEKLEEQFLQKPSENYLPLMSEGSKINELTVDSEGILNADLSSGFINGMNLGAGYEQLVLQSLTDTLGGYFGVSKVRITIDGKPYESGHIRLDIMEVSR
jgi:hypothetical protein